MASEDPPKAKREDRTLTSLKQALEALHKDLKDWWPFKPPWMRPKRPAPKPKPEGEKKRLPEKEKVDA